MSIIITTSLYPSQVRSEMGMYEDAVTVEQPASPTSALWVPADREVRQRRGSKSVRFADDVKQHDGLSIRNALMDKLIATYFVDQREISETDIFILTERNLARIAELHEDLLDMANRLSKAVEDGKQCAPVLPGGGGLCTKLCVPHLPYVQILDRVVEAALNRIMRAQGMLA